MKKQYEVSIAQLGLTHNSYRLDTVYKPKSETRPLITSLFQDGQHIVGYVDELPENEQMLINKYIKERLK